MFTSFIFGFLTGIVLFILFTFSKVLFSYIREYGFNQWVVLLFVLLTLSVLSSCSKDEVYPDVCIDGNCDAILKLQYPQDSNGFYHVKLDGTTRFDIEIFADNINDYWRYGGKSVAFAKFYSDASRIILGDEVKLVQETEVYLSEVGSNELYGKRIIGPVVNEFIGDTITVDATVYWDGGVKLYEKYQKTLKIILE